MTTKNRHLAAILFTDIVGYTSMMQRDERYAVRIIKQYNHVLENEVTKYGGEILNNYGDGSLCTFISVFDALSCAIEMQQNLQQEPIVPMRIGLHVGEIFFEDDKVLGDGVNVASRIQSLGIENSILLSAEVHQNIKNHPEFATISLGKFEFKNVNEPMEVFALLNHGLKVPLISELSGKLKSEVRKSFPLFTTKYIIWVALLILIAAGIFGGRWLWQSRFSASKYSEQSIAVLPFVNLSNDAEQDYFSNGITEDILNHLVKLPNLKVKSRTSTLPYKDTKKSIKEIGKELGVNHILEGTVRKVNQDIRVVVQLIDAENDIQLWSETYDRKLEDILAIQTDIAIHAANALALQFTNSQFRTDKSTTKSIVAYDYFMQSREAFNNSVSGENKLALALSLINRAIELQPEFSKAHALKSRIFFHSRVNGVSENEWRDSSLWYAENAIHADKDDPAGYFARSQVNYYLGNIKIYRDDLERSFELSPNDYEILLQYGYQLLDERKEIGAEYILQAIESNYSNTDPHYYLAWSDALGNLLESGYPIRERVIQTCILRFPYYTNARYELAYLYRQTGEYDKSLNTAKATFDENQDNINSADNLAWSYFMVKNYEQSILYWSRYKDYESRFKDSTQRITFRHRLGMAYMAKGDLKTADRLFSEQLVIQKGMISNQRSRGVQNSSMAGVYYDLAVCEAYFNHYEETLDALEKSFFTYHYFWTWGLKNEPLWQKYIQRAEFQNLIKRAEEIELFKKHSFEKALLKIKPNKEIERLLK
ncbi:MAG: hypothetical protein MUF39_09700 [Cyclobacteriaceae bacterium]|nr:hypothetical protein [Cyclobacteriaceae bacterium]